MNYGDAEGYIHSLTRFGSQLGLERLGKLLELMGNPQKKLKYIHIAGTNGKGSTANMCANILSDAGYCTGLYTSPFVNDFRERFQINGEMIPRKEFSDIIVYVKAYIERLAEHGCQVTEFEAVTAVAFEYFARNKCDIVCLEVGLGGQFDATNIIDTPEVTIITSISYDHVAILGDTIPKIASEKAGIIKSNATVITYPLQEDEALEVIKKKCVDTGSTLIVPDAKMVSHISSNAEYTNFDYEDVRYATLIGDHQAYNTVVVIEAMKILREKGFRIATDSVHLSIAKTRVPARFERYFKHKNPAIYFDGAHNIQAITALAESVERVGNGNVVAIMGMMSDKDYQRSIEKIATKCSAFIAVDVNNPRAEKREIIANEAKKYCKTVYDFGEYADAIDMAIKSCGDEGVIIICGSFYLIGDIKTALRKYSHGNKVT